MAVNKEGKFTKLEDGTIKKLEHAFSIGSDITSACIYANISTPTYYSWIKQDKKLEKRFNELRDKPVLKAYETINKDMGKIETAKWYIERKKKKEFSLRQEITGEDGKDLGVIMYPTKKDEDTLETT